MTKEKIKDILERTLKTFLQAFLSALSVDVLIGVTDFATLKKLALSVLIGAVAAGICAVWNTALDAINLHLSGKGAGTMTFDDFIKKNKGKDTDYDGAYGAQCVDLIKMYLRYVFGITPKSIGNAHAYFDNFTLHPFLKNNFVRIKNSPKFVPMKGDICIWSKKMNKYGHVSIATGEGDTNSFVSFDMNWGGTEAKFVTHNYNYFLGVLRPIHRNGIDVLKLFKVKKAVNVRKGPGVGFARVMFDEFTDYQKEQVIANGGKPADNDFPAGMIIEGYGRKGAWVKISATEDRWVSANLVEELK